MRNGSPHIATRERTRAVRDSVTEMAFDDGIATANKLGSDRVIA
jgi:hypothetical protein